MRKSENGSVFQFPVQKEPPHRNCLPHRFGYSVYYQSHRVPDYMRENNLYPREKGMNEDPGKRSKAIMHRSTKNRLRLGSGKFESQDSKMYLMQAYCNKKVSSIWSTEKNQALIISSTGIIMRI